MIARSIAGALLALLAPFAAAQEQRAKVAGVEVRALYAWPEALYGGYFPIRMELANSNAEDVEIEIQADGLGGAGRTFKRVRLAPNEHQAFDLLCVAQVESSNGYDLTCRVGREKQVFGNLGPVMATYSNRQVILLVTPEVPPPGAREAMEQSLGQNEYHVGDVLFEHLPERFEAYTSIDAVLLGVDAGLPPPDRLEPILRWTRLGGTLVLFGAEATQVGEGSDALRPWLEPRFLVSQVGDSRAAWSYGQGRLVCIDSDDLLTGSLDEFLVEHVSRSMGLPGWVPRPLPTRGTSLAPIEEAMSPLPLKALAVMLVLFALLIGPVNFIAVRRLGRPSLLLVTVPGLALLASLGLLGYGVLQQGLDVKQVTRSFALLDQRMRRASTVELRNLFAGGLPGPGLRPAEGTACFVHRVDRRLETLLSVDQTDGTLLGADFLPVRQPASHALLSDAAARARLEVAREGQGLAVTNGLGAPVVSLILRAPDGAHFRLGEPLGDGAVGTLAPVDEDREADALAAEWEEWAPAYFGRQHVYLPPGTFLAQVERSPFTDDCGLELETIRGEHFVLGVLDLEDEAWR